MSSIAPKLSNKRSYNEEIEDDLDAYFDEVEAEEQEQMVPVEGRRIARLKISPRKHTVGFLGAYTPVGGVDGDFEEAAFLAPMETD